MAPSKYRWPDHWYHDPGHIHCIVPNCGFITLSLAAEAQWHELVNHCADEMNNEHELLKKILYQSCCAIDECDHPAFGAGITQRARELFAHGSAYMSDICSFVRLAREGRIVSGVGRNPEPDCERLAFLRMLEKMLARPVETVKLLYQKNGYHNIHQQNPENMGRILTADPLRQQGEEPPIWWPIRSEHFLWLCRPDPSNPADDGWRAIWTDLREDYANGRI
ncbi:hypothetical protein IMSHALPRED_008235 [Imshaugia aleurites]|uniref:Uncharacterized protein n=1 Tax=Imshaugia aleurites TaxID=172621 RepID=A0A8H3ISX8_9LECA|nr:hypothetical protein IMSHALPRED_008235 [Imshaugia aleurites]